MWKFNKTALSLAQQGHQDQRDAGAAGRDEGCHPEILKLRVLGLRGGSKGTLFPSILPSI